MKENKKYLIIILVLLSIILSLFITKNYILENSTNYDLQNEELSSESLGVQANLEKNKKALINSIKEKFIVKKQKVRENQDLSEEEKNNQIDNLNSKMNSEILDARNRLNRVADNKIKEIIGGKVKTANKESKFISNAEEFILADNNQELKYFDDTEFKEKIDNIENYYRLDDYYKNNKETVDNLINKELNSIPDEVKLPGSYVHVVGVD